ncbi:hypothetical protein C4E44_16750, partial [Pseudomonas sp. MWU12-2312b]
NHWAKKATIIGARAGNRNTGGDIADGVNPGASAMYMSIQAILKPHKTKVGASLLAKRPSHSTSLSTVRPHSRAGSLPQGKYADLVEQHCRLLQGHPNTPRQRNPHD